MDYNFSHSMLASWRRCRYRFYLQYIEKVPGKAGIGMLKGSAGHAALAEWYKSTDAKAATEAAWQTFQDKLQQQGMEVQGFSKEWVELEQALQRYYEYSIREDYFQWVASELEFNLSYKQHNFRGFIDGVVRDTRTDQLWLLEHKFNKQVNTYHLDLDPQISIYMMAVVMMGYDVTGVLYNIIRMGGGKTAEREPVVRKLLYRNREGLAATAAELQLQMEEVSRWIDNADRIVYRNATKDCSWDCGFYRVCLAIEDSGSGQETVDMLRLSSERRSNEVQI